MSQRTMAALLALPLLLVLLVMVAIQPLPYVTYSPGPTVDILSTRDGEETVQVSGHEAYYDDGELRLTTIYVDQPQEKVTLDRLVAAWIDPTEAVYPRSAVYAPDETDETNDTESAVQMVSSQDAAVATALTELGYDVEPVVEVLNVQDGYPADGPAPGARRPPARSAAARSRPPRTWSTPSTPRRWASRWPSRSSARASRSTSRSRRRSSTATSGSASRPGPGYTFPFEVSVDIGDGIGGPSAGLMFSLAIYDTLTPGSLTGGEVVAGTGTIDADGPHRPHRRHPAEDRRCRGRRGAPLHGRRPTTAPTPRGSTPATCAWCGPTRCTTPWRRSRPGSTTRDAPLPTCEEQS